MCYDFPECDGPTRCTFQMSTSNHSAEAIFTAIYAGRRWGRSADPADRFVSGRGSRDPAIIDPYVTSVQAFIQSLGFKPSALDFGCGDFTVGARIRHLFDHYTACDVVRPLIEHNQQRFRHLHVDFRTLDISRDPLPEADVGMVRQVLQHLSNDLIARFVAAVPHSCRYLICTEHLPAVAGFTPNHDKPTDAGIRLNIGSGVDLTKPPFSLAVVSEHTLCTVPQLGGLIVTTLYQLR